MIRTTTNEPDTFGSVEEATQRRETLKADLLHVEGLLQAAHFVGENGRVLYGRECGARRLQLVARKERIISELRSVKRWMRDNATHKPSEWEMLGKCYRLFSRLEDQGVDLGDDGETLLALLELHVPHAFLGCGTEPTPTAGKGEP